MEGKPKVAAMKAKEVEGWKKHFALGHRPFRRDCRLCIEQMGSQKPHRRRSMEDRMSSAWSVSVDIVGPLTNTVDLVTKRPVKYALIWWWRWFPTIKAVKDGDGLHDQGEQGERQEDEEQPNGGGVQPDSQGPPKALGRT